MEGGVWAGGWARVEGGARPIDRSRFLPPLGGGGLHFGPPPPPPPHTERERES
eukprot:COSAG03_NODE_22525_length_290_cov_0.544503_1_plen_52_part_10